MVASGTTSRTRQTAAKPRISSSARVKKSFHPVATNVASYDKKDPFAAADALRKLLTSLPTRPGGCQYKMTQEEHVLSMHLLAIVEPFVGLSPSRRGLTLQPTENLDEIVSYIDSKRDLLSLALSCKRMHGVIFPRHFEYRVIRCKISNIAVWVHFANNRALAANVRRLEILDERSTQSPCIPSDILSSDTDLESSDDELGLHEKHGRLFVSALSKMTDLASVVWSCNHSLVSLHSIWPTLLKCQLLKSVEIQDNWVFGPAKDATPNAPKKQAILPSLSTVSVRSFRKGYGQSKTSSLNRITEMLHQCPNLKELHIDYNAQSGHVNPSADDFFLCGRWPSLSALKLTHLSCSLDGFDAASSFLTAHENIEVLHLDVGPRANIAGIVLASGSLPRLRELKSSKEVACAIMACPADTLRPLETIKGVRLTGQQRDTAFFETLQRYDVKRIELAGYGTCDDIRKLVDTAPKLTWLDVGRKCSGSAHGGPLAISNVVEWANALSQLPDLTTFHGVPFFYEVSSGPTSLSTISDRSRIKKNDEVASVLAWKCPNLRRLDHWDQDTGKVIILLKDGEKTRWEVRRVKV